MVVVVDEDDEEEDEDEESLKTNQRHSRTAARITMAAPRKHRVRNAGMRRQRDEAVALAEEEG